MELFSKLFSISTKKAILDVWLGSKTPLLVTATLDQIILTLKWKRLFWNIYMVYANFRQQLKNIVM